MVSRDSLAIMFSQLLLKRDNLFTVRMKMDLFEYLVSYFMTLGLRICIRLLRHANKVPVTQKFIVSQLWRPDVRVQGIAGFLFFFLKAQLYWIRARSKDAILTGLSTRLFPNKVPYKDIGSQDLKSFCKGHDTTHSQSKAYVEQPHLVILVNPWPSRL